MAEIIADKGYHSDETVLAVQRRSDRRAAGCDHFLPAKCAVKRRVLQKTPSEVG
jgi:hypothetical protein